MNKKSDWNSLVKVEDKHPTPKFKNRKGKLTHIIIHLTGGVSFEDAKKAYCNPDKYTKGKKKGEYKVPKSAHYVIKAWPKLLETSAKARL